MVHYKDTNDKMKDAVDFKFQSLKIFLFALGRKYGVCVYR